MDWAAVAAFTLVLLSALSVADAAVTLIHKLGED